MKDIMGVIMIGGGIYMTRYIENDMGLLIVSLWIIAVIFLIFMPGERRCKPLK